MPQDLLLNLPTVVKHISTLRLQNHFLKHSFFYIEWVTNQPFFKHQNHSFPPTIAKLKVQCRGKQQKTKHVFYLKLSERWRVSCFKPQNVLPPRPGDFRAPRQSWHARGCQHSDTWQHCPHRCSNQIRSRLCFQESEVFVELGWVLVGFFDRCWGIKGMR